MYISPVFFFLHRNNDRRYPGDSSKWCDSAIMSGKRAFPVSKQDSLDDCFTLFADGKRQYSIYLFW